MSQNPNLKEFFESGFCEDYWGWECTEKVSQKEAEQVLRLLGAKQGHILDWRGGWGRHAIYFAERGFEVTILDFIGRYLELAKRKFKEKGLRVKIIETDSRNTPASIQADFATCIGNSVGFLDKTEELKTFKSLQSAIKPGGKLFVDCMNLFYLSRVLKSPIEKVREDGYIYRNHNNFNFETNILHSVFEIIDPNGRSVSKEFNQTLYTPHDLRELITKAGFKVDNIYGSFEGNPITFESPKIVLVAHKI